MRGDYIKIDSSMRKFQGTWLRGLGTKNRRRYRDTVELLTRYDTIRRMNPEVNAAVTTAMLANKHGDWARQRGLACGLRSLQNYRMRVDGGSRRFDGNCDLRGGHDRSSVELDGPSIRRRARALGLTIADLASKVGCSSGTIAKTRRGKRIGIDFALRIKELLGLAPGRRPSPATGGR